jgi:hypothetical protein
MPQDGVKPTLNVQVHIDVRTLATLHLDQVINMGLESNQFSTLLNTALEVYTALLIKKGRITPCAEVSEAVAILRQAGYPLTQIREKGRASRKIIAALACEALAGELDSPLGQDTGIDEYTQNMSASLRADIEADIEEVRRKLEGRG